MRLDFQRIAAAVPHGASVLDLGCAEGDMLAYLRAERAARGVGADIDRDGLIRCFERGVQAVYCDINKGLGMFYDNAFAVVALSQTLQSVRLPPQKLLREMLRIGDVAIVSFPNFGHWRLRQQLLSGVMPGNPLLPYHWHDTPNVRYCTIKDFEQLCREEGLQTRQSVFLAGTQQITFAPNLYADMAIYVLSRTAQ